MAAKGDFGKVIINGYDATAESQNLNPNDAYVANPVQFQNVGYAGFGKGPYAPTLAWNGLRKTAQALTAHQLLAQNVQGIGAANDVEYVISLLLGNNAAPVMGDAAFLMDARELNYTDTSTPGDIMKFASQMRAFGKRGGFGNVIGDQAATTTGTIVLGPYDRGAAANAGTSLGGVAHLQCVTPAGVPATGTVTIAASLATDADTVVINGTTYTLKTALTPTPGQVLIGATTAATAANLYAAMIGSVSGSGTQYAAGTTKVPNTGASGIVVSKPVGLVITLTAALNGVGGNSLTLTSAGGANKPVVSGATLTGGLAGDSYAVVIASAATSGGSYTTLGTFVSTLQQQAGERLEIAIGTLIQRWVKITATTGGSTSKPAFNVCFRGFYN